MRRNRQWLGLILLGLTLVVAPIAHAQDEEVPVVPTGSSNSVSALLYARPFTLEVPYANVWTKEMRTMTSGHILVLDVDPTLVVPKDTWTPVLYVGTRPAETANVGSESGRLIVLVPGDTDVYTSPAYFGSVQLPERVDTARGEAELAAAREIGVRPFSKEMVDTALRVGGDPLRARTIDDVYRSLSDVVHTYSPQESELAIRYGMIPATE